MIEQIIISWAPGLGPRKIIGALCQDGKQRTAEITAAADTFFSVPARVHASGTTVAGYVTTDSICTHCMKANSAHAFPFRPESGECEGRFEWLQDVYLFRAYTYRKNWRLVTPGEGSA